MVSNRFPIDTGNATNINKKSVSESRLIMYRLENIFDFLSGEPNSIIVKEREGGSSKIYKCILMVRFWEQVIWDDMKRSCSWSIYSNDRHNLNNLILRRVIWDSKKDREFVKKNIIEHQEMVMEMSPSIEICNQYIACPQSDHIIQLVFDLDAEIENGFVLQENNTEMGQWRDLELLRLYDWGQVHMTWCTEKKNECVEQCIKKLVSDLNTYAKQENANIFSMCLNYSATPERFRNWINGDVE